MTSASLIALAGLLVALLIGLAVGWLAASFRLGHQLMEVKSQVARSGAECESARAQADRLQENVAEWRGRHDTGVAENATLGASIARMEEQIKGAEQKYGDMKTDLLATFQSVAGEALKGNNESFLRLAKEHLATHTTTADRNLEAREKAVEALLAPVKLSLTRLEEQTRSIESERVAAYSGVRQMVNSINSAYLELRGETRQLVTALRSPNARGNWGELQLKRCVEFAGMIEHCTFNQQHAVVTEEGAGQKPDLVVHLPNGREIVVDAKTPFDAYLDSLIATDEATRCAKLAAYAERVRTHIKQLSSKDYSKQFANSPDFVVCFLSSEVFFSAALEQDPSLIERGAKANVVLATPTTLISLLKAVAYGWQQVEVTRNAIEIRNAGQALYDKMLGVQAYLANMGKAIDNSVKQYNQLIGAVEGRASVFYQVRKLKALGVGEEEICETRALESAVRPMAAEDWDAQAPLFLASVANGSSELTDADDEENELDAENELAEQVPTSTLPGLRAVSPT